MLHRVAQVLHAIDWRSMLAPTAVGWLSGSGRERFMPLSFLLLELSFSFCNQVSQKNNLHSLASLLISHFVKKTVVFGINICNNNCCSFLFAVFPAMSLSNSFPHTPVEL